jgi:hypothetical protein
MPKINTYDAAIPALTDKLIGSFGENGITKNALISELFKLWFYGVYNAWAMGTQSGGVSDESALVNAAIEAGYKIFYFPAATYLVTTSIVWPAGYYSIYGDSRVNSILYATSDDVDIFQVSGAANLEIDSLRFHNVGAGGSCIKSTTGTVIDSIITRCWFSGTGKVSDGIDARFSTTTISACVFEGLSKGIINFANPSYLNLSDLIYYDVTTGLDTPDLNTINLSNIHTISL